jgi:hypothetical protein
MAEKHDERSKARKKDVAEHLSRLKGKSRADLASDKGRGASSSLGHGHIAEREERRKRR